jgi:ABC-type amino acid transport substrate-binding protein
MQARKLAAVRGTPSEQWLTRRIDDLELVAGVIPVTSYDVGMRELLERKVDALFGERAILLDAAARHTAARDLRVLDRLFTREPMALAFARGDEEFRAVVDGALSRLYRSGEIGTIYARWFGEPDAETLAFLQASALPD